MSRQQLEALGYKFVESDLPPIVRDWSIGDAVLCATLIEFDYSDKEAWKKLKPYPIERVLGGYWFFGGLVVKLGMENPHPRGFYTSCSTPPTYSERFICFLHFVDF